MDNNFTNPENNTQNVAGNTYSYDYMNNTTTATPQPEAYQTSYAQDTTTSYSQPGTFTGDTAAWQANNQAQKVQQTTVFDTPTYNYNAVPQKKNQGIALSIVALVLGILSLVCCCFGAWNLILGIPGVIVGIIALVKKAAGKGMAIAGVICAGLAIVLGIVMTILSVLGMSSMSDGEILFIYIYKLSFLCSKLSPIFFY